MYLCGVSNVVYHEDTLTGVKENVSVYVSSKYFDEMKMKGTIDADNYDQISKDIVNFADESLFQFLENLKNKTDSELLQAIKEDESYPFKGEISDVIIKEQQKMFDIVALEVVKNYKKTIDPKIKKLNYKLIAEAINTNPSSLKKILAEVFNLSKDKQDELAKILDNISLNNIISTMQEVTNRLLFLDVLNEIIYGTSAKEMKERTEFQKILLDELCIFGDKYKYGTDDQSLKNILKKHIKELGRAEFIDVNADVDNEELNNIPDFCLFNKQKIGEKYENLIVEIKRPIKDIGEEQISQIKKYAFAIKDDPGFDKTATTWNFILVGRKFDKFAISELSGKIDGLINDADGIKIYIKKWSDIITEQKLRYEYFKEHSQIKITELDVSGDLENRWNKIKGSN